MKNFVHELQALSLTDDNSKIIEEISIFYVSIDENARIEFRDKMFFNKLNLKILNLSGLIVENSINRKDFSIIHNALLLHSIEDFKWDYRENYIYLSIINYACEYFKQNIKNELDAIRDVSSENTNRLLSDFFDRSKSLKSLKAMGLMASKIDSIIKFDILKPPWAK